MDLTDRLALRKPAGSDPFLRSDINYNADRLDDFPGVFPCTASTRPSWGADQAGLFIHETDTGKFVRWTGAAWVTPNVFPKAAMFSANPNVTIAPNTNYTQAMGSFTPPRACNVLIFGKVRIGRISQDSNAAGHAIFLDGVDITHGHTTLAYFPNAIVADPHDDRSCPLFGYATGVTAASHALTVRVDAGAAVSSILYYSVSLTALYLDN